MVTSVAIRLSRLLACGEEIGRFLPTSWLRETPAALGSRNGIGLNVGRQVTVGVGPSRTDWRSRGL